MPTPFGKHVRLTVRPHRVRGSTQRLSQTIVSPVWLAVLVAAAAAIPAIGYVVANAADIYTESSGPVNLACSASLRQQSFTANASWQEVIVNGTDKNFESNCALEVTFTANTNEVSFSYAKRQPVVLVKVHDLRFLPANSKCLHGNLTLHVRSPVQNARQADICNAVAVDALHIWVNESIEIYLFVWPLQQVRASFSVGFVATRAVDVCQGSSIPSERLIIDNDLYVFAPHSTFINFLQNSTPCSSSKKLRLEAVSTITALDVKVLAAPTDRGCWSLWLNEFRINGTQSSNFFFRTNITMHYELSNSTSGCNSDEVQRGFTLQFIAVAATTVASTFAATTIPAAAPPSTAAAQSPSTTIPGSNELEGESEAIKIGSAVAAVLVVAGVVLTVAWLLIRRRHTQIPEDSSHQTTAVLRLADSDAERPVKQLMSTAHYPRPQSQHGAICSVSSDTAVSTSGEGCVDFVMTDNDLYGTAFGS